MKQSNKLVSEKTYNIEYDHINEGERQKMETTQAKRRKTIFTINMSSRENILKDLVQITEGAKKAFSGASSFSSPSRLREAAKENGYKIDQGAVVSDSVMETLVEEMKNGQDGENSPGFGELHDYIIKNRVFMDWRPYLEELDKRVEGGVFFFVNHYLASCLLSIKDKDIRPSQTLKKENGFITEKQAKILKSKVKHFRKLCSKFSEMEETNFGSGVILSNIDFLLKKNNKKYEGVYEGMDEEIEMNIEYLELKSRGVKNANISYSLKKGVYCGILDAFGEIVEDEVA